MKTLYSVIIILIIFTSVISKKKFKKHVPHATDLANHFGGPTISTPDGSHTGAEDYVEANPEVFIPQKYDGVQKLRKSLEFHPSSGLESKTNTHPVRSGDFTNIAPSASKVITPEVAGPKLHLETEISYPAQVKMPTFYGFRKEYHPVTAYDKVEGKIIHDEVLLNKPLYGYEDKV